jgi:hypothetical protein
MHYYTWLSGSYSGNKALFLSVKRHLIMKNGKMMLFAELFKERSALMSANYYEILQTMDYWMARRRDRWAGM